MAIIIGILGMIINIDQNRSQQWDTKTSFVVETSIGNHGKDPGYYDKPAVNIQLGLNLLFICILIFSSIILRLVQNKMIKDIDERNLTPSDFGVMATNLPLNKSKEEVEQWIKSHFESFEIVYINYCYDIKEIVKVIRKLTFLKQMEAYLNAYKKKKLKELGINEKEAIYRNKDLSPPPTKRCFCCKKEYPTKEEIFERIKQTEEELKEIHKKMDETDEKDLYCGTAFIVFNKQSEADQTVAYFQVNLLRRAFTFLIYDILR